MIDGRTDDEMFAEKEHEGLLEMRKSRRSTVAKRYPKGQIQMGYLLFLIFAVALGNIQFGYAIGGWNVATAAYARLHNWGDSGSSTYVNY